MVSGRAAMHGMIALCLLLAAGIFTSAASASDTVASVTPWMHNAAPMGWSASLDRVIYNSSGADGMFDAYSAKPDGSDPRCLTCSVPSFPGVGTATQRGASDVSPDGNYMLLEVESGNHLGPIGSAISAPGKGTANDVWLAPTDGSQAWPLTDIATAGQGALGTMWARFDRTGTRVVWAELYAPAILNLGSWRLKLADIVWTDGVPSLTNVTTIEPQSGHFYEAYGFSPDNSHIIFASDIGRPHWWDSQIYSIALDGTQLTRLTPDNGADGFFTNYNEFAFYVPGDSQIIYASTRNSPTAGMDYWLMNPDGTGQQQLTSFNRPGSPDYRGYAIVGGLAFDPAHPDRFVAGVASDPSASTIDAVMITLNPSPPAASPPAASPAPSAPIAAAPTPYAGPRFAGATLTSLHWSRTRQGGRTLVLGFANDGITHASLQLTRGGRIVARRRSTRMRRGHRRLSLPIASGVSSGRAWLQLALSGGGGPSRRLRRTVQIPPLEGSAQRHGVRASCAPDARPGCARVGQPEAGGDGRSPRRLQRP